MALFTRNSKRIDAERVAETRAAFEELGRLSLAGVTPINGIVWREHVKVAGRVKALRIQPWAEQIASLELTLADSTGGVTVVFMGRRTLGGVKLGTHLVIEGMASEHHGLLTILNPTYQLLPRQVTLPF
jgi:RecG-like helicase